MERRRRREDHEISGDRIRQHGTEAHAMATAAQSKKAKATEKPATGVDDVPDDMLWLILLHLDSPVWLIRAGCTCKRWRGIVAADGHAILRRAGRLHPPAVAGHYHHHRSGAIAFVPSPRHASIDSRRFSLDFLPPDGCWYRNSKLLDCHGGLVLLLLAAPLRMLVVCNPLARQFRAIRYHAPGDEDTADDGVIADAFLVDGDGGDISVSNFRVMYRFKTGPWACLFSTPGRGDGFLPRASADTLDTHRRGQVAGRVDGRLYLGLFTGSVIALDSATLEFSLVGLPSGVDTSRKGYHASFRVVHSGGTAARIVHANGEGLEVFRRVRGGGGGGEWVLEHSVCRLSEVARGMPSYLAERPSHWGVRVIADGVGFALLSVLDVGERCWLFTLDVGTMEVQFVPESAYHLYRETKAISTYTLPYVV